MKLTEIRTAITKAETDVAHITDLVDALQTAVNDAQTACSNAQTAHSRAVLVYVSAESAGSPAVDTLRNVMDNAQRIYERI